MRVGVRPASAPAAVLRSRRCSRPMVARNLVGVSTALSSGETTCFTASNFSTGLAGRRSALLASAVYLSTSSADGGSSVGSSGSGGSGASQASIWRLAKSTPPESPGPIARPPSRGASSGHKRGVASAVGGRVTSDSYWLFRKARLSLLSNFICSSLQAGAITVRARQARRLWSDVALVARYGVSE